MANCAPGVMVSPGPRGVSHGALVATTGARSGRSSRDKFILDDAITHDPVECYRAKNLISLCGVCSEALDVRERPAGDSSCRLA